VTKITGSLHEELGISKIALVRDVTTVTMVSGSTIVFMVCGVISFSIIFSVPCSQCYYGWYNYHFAIVSFVFIVAVFC
jgi:hypothetical protein